MGQVIDKGRMTGLFISASLDRSSMGHGLSIKGVREQRLSVRIVCKKIVCIFEMLLWAGTCATLLVSAGVL